MKKLSVFLFFLLLCASSGAAEIAGDFDGDQEITLKDVAYALAYALDNSLTLTTLPGSADNIYSKATGPVSRLPDTVKDNFDSNDGFGLGDVAALLAFYLASDKSFSAVETSTVTIYSKASSLYKLPGTPIGDSSFSTTITGIQTD